LCIAASGLKWKRSTNTTETSRVSAQSRMVFLVARGLRILPEFAAFCRGRLLKCFVFRVSFGTLDQHIGVRIPGGQPNYSVGSPRSSSEL